MITGNANTPDRTTIEAARRVCDRLNNLEFKPLRRPLYRPAIGRSENEVRWALRVFACPSLSLFRNLLDEFLIAYDQRLEGACFMLARGMLEVVAITNYVCQLAEPLVELKRWDRAWDEVLRRASMGSFYLKEHAPSFRSEHILPLDVGKAIKSLASIVPEGMQADNGYLSELCHPCSLSLMRYVDVGENGANFQGGRQFDSRELEYALGITIAIAALSYNRMLLLADLKTTLRRFAEAVHAFIADVDFATKRVTAP